MPAAAPAARIQLAHTRVNVLIAHPSDPVRSSVREVLERYLFEVVDTPSARDLPERCRREQPSVLLVASELLEEDGADLLDTMRGDSVLARVSIVVIDPAPELQTTLERMSHGAHDVLRDPGDAAELLARVQSASQANELRRMLRRWAEDLPELAFTDEVTRLYNRKFLVRQLSGLIAGARRHGRALAVALVDIDHFKRINDTLGHAAGDEVLARLAELVRGELREEDYSGRYGGDEFLLLLPDATADGARATCRKLLTAIGHASLASAGRPLSLSASIGWADWTGEELHELVARADEALYRAKRDGRGRAYGPLDSDEPSAA
jgi:diguanylate cyclase (GGDEF)-like protein